MYNNDGLLKTTMYSISRDAWVTLQLQGSRAVIRPYAALKHDILGVPGGLRGEAFWGLIHRILLHSTLYWMRGLTCTHVTRVVRTH